MTQSTELTLEQLLTMPLAELEKLQLKNVNLAPTQPVDYRAQYLAWTPKESRLVNEADCMSDLITNKYNSTMIDWLRMMSQ